MARGRRAEYDSDEFATRYLAGETLDSLADWLGVTKIAVFKAARRRNLPRRNLREHYQQMEARG